MAAHPLTAAPPQGSLDAHLGVARGDFRLRVHLRAGPGETVALLGPNGAGKTTVLRALAGLQPLDEGRIELGGRVLDDAATGTLVPPERRPIGLVFQDYVLFPHLSGLENVAFGLRSGGMRRGEARRRAQQWLDRVGIGDRAGARPSALSGGQAQRVALARALAIEPGLLLLDEPLAALDAGARTDVRRDLRRVLDAFGGTCLLVTHDPVDAFVLADRVVVLEQGRVTQEGDLADVAARPRSRYVADLVGVNLLRGEGHGPDGGEGSRTGIRLPGGAVLVAADPVPAGPVFAAVHPRAVALHPLPPGAGSPRNCFAATVAGLDPEGLRLRVRLEGAVPLVAEVTAAAASQLALQPGDAVWATVKAAEVEVYAA